MLGISLKCARFPYGKTGKHPCAMNVSGNMCPALLAFIETDERENSSRKAFAKVESNLETK